MSECSHNCESCSAGCGKKQEAIQKLKLGKNCTVKKIIGISSGKGGVGKSFVTSLLASGLRKKGFNVGILDADVLGPSIPLGFGILDKNILANEDGLMIPKQTLSGIKIMSSNLLLENDTDPIIYRGALISGVLEQFYQETAWGDLDFLFIDMPPGTGDIPLTVYQTIPIDKVVIVTSPQNLVSMIVEKSINMANMMNIDILGVIENMSYVVCPKCSEKIEIFGVGQLEEILAGKGTKILAHLPMRVEYNKLVDEGMIEEIDMPELDETIENIKNLI